MMLRTNEWSSGFGDARHDCFLFWESIQCAAVVVSHQKQVSTRTRSQRSVSDCVRTLAVCFWRAHAAYVAVHSWRATAPR